MCETVVYQSLDRSPTHSRASRDHVKFFLCAQTVKTKIAISRFKIDECVMSGEVNQWSRKDSICLLRRSEIVSCSRN
jgi:hypothetical protein